MAGMYPDNKIEKINGQDVPYPGVGEDGKYTSGDFNNPLVPPSRLDAGTINLIIDNLNDLITSMGLEPNNTGGQQLAALFSVAAEANKGIRRDAHGRAKVAPPAAGDDIARKAEVDAEANARQAQDTTLGSRITAAINSLTGETNAFKALFNTFVARRNNPHAVTKAQVGLSLCDNTGDSAKRVSYANTAGSAPANGGNASTVFGIDITALNPVVASSFGTTAGYIKYRNGLLIQFGKTPIIYDAPVYFPIAYSAYVFPLCTPTAHMDVFFIRNISKNGFTIATAQSASFEWIAIGI